MIYAHPPSTTIRFLPVLGQAQSSYKKNQTMTLEEIQIKPNGEKVYYLSVKSPIHDAKGNAIGLLECD